MNSKLPFKKQPRLFLHGYRLPINPNTSAETTPLINQQEAAIGAKTSIKAKIPKLTLPKSLAIPQNGQHFGTVSHLLSI